MWILIKSKGFLKFNDQILKIVNDGNSIYVVSPNGTKIKGVTEDDRNWEFPGSGLPTIQIECGPALGMMWVCINP